MANFEELYLKLFRANEKAINILIEAQRECEDAYINSPEPEIIRLYDIKKSEDKQ